MLSQFPKILKATSQTAYQRSTRVFWKTERDKVNEEDLVKILNDP
jgi:hypothetical protein